MRQAFLLAIAVIFTFLSGCENKNESDILLFVKPDKDYLSVKDDERIDFEIECSATSKIETFRIGEKNSEYATDFIFDTTLNSTSLKFSYSYYFPSNYEKDEITIVFSAEDINQKKKQLAKRILLIKEDTLLNETTGHRFYSNLSEEADGYNLKENKPVYTTYNDSSEIHVFDASSLSSHGETLSRRWETMANVTFVAYNDFDYANATNASIQNAYNSGIKKEFVNNIEEDDIIIANIGDTSLIAIKILSVFDPDSTNLDRYIFNIKK